MLNIYPLKTCVILASILLASCSGGGSGGNSGDSDVTDGEVTQFVSAVFGECGSGKPIEVPCGFPIPREEDNNPLSVEKIELGRFLFYDRNMSFNQTQSCADCHLQDRAFTDGLTVSVGSQGDMHPRNAMSMTNVVYNGTMNWANNAIVDLDLQALGVLTNVAPIELGWEGHEAEILARFVSPDTADYAGTLFSGAAPDYPTMFAAAFPDDVEKITMFTVSKALAAFGSTMISGDSDFDKFQRGEMNNMSEAAKRGNALFLDERLECFHCHGGFNFSDSVDHTGVKIAQNTFHNNALYNLDTDGDGIGDGAFPADNPGIKEFTLLPEDEGKFRAPTLRNIALTAPYMHDGSIATLDEVIDHYARGGRLIDSGPNAGDGAKNPNRSGLINGFAITADERLDLIAFFNSLTDYDFVCRDSLSDPFGIISKHSMCP